MAAHLPVMSKRRASRKNCESGEAGWLNEAFIRARRVVGLSDKKDVNFSLENAHAIFTAAQ